MRIAVAIRAFNEAKNVGEVLGKFHKEYDVIFVDDGSTDGTDQIARSFGVKVIKHCVNLGAPFAFRTGFIYALSEGYDVIFEFDADGQHDPADIPRFIDELNKTGCDIVCGSRILGSYEKDWPLARVLGLPMVNWVLNKITGWNLTDTMCGFRAHRADRLRGTARLLLLDAPFEREYGAAEYLIKASRLGFTVSEIPIHVSSRKHGVSYQGTFRYGWGVLNAVVKTVLSNKPKKAETRIIKD